MTKETRLSIWIVAVILIVVLAGFWLLGGSRDSDDSEPSVLEKSLVSPEGTVSETGLPAPNASSGTVQREENQGSGSAQSGMAGDSKVTDASQASDSETFQIIVREPVTVDGVDVGKILEGKVINSEDEIVNNPSDN